MLCRNLTRTLLLFGQRYTQTRTNWGAFCPYSPWKHWQVVLDHLTLIYSSHVSHVKHLRAFPCFTDLEDPPSVLSCKVLFNGLVCFQWNRLEKIGSEIKVVGENNIFPICFRMFSLIVLHRVLICWLFQCQKLQLVHWVHKASFQQLADFSVPLSRIRAMCSWRQDHEEFVFCHWNDLNILFKPVWQDGSSPYVPWGVVRMLFFSLLHR